MSVLTTAYSISPKMMRKIRRDYDCLESIFEEDSDWKVEFYCFDKGWEETIGILGECGFEKTYAKLQTEDYLDYDGYDIWTVTPAAVKMADKDLETANFEELKAAGLAKNVTDYYGKPIPEYLYSYYVGDIKEIKKFIRKAAANGNYLLFATA